MSKSKKGYSLNIKPLIFILSILPCYIIGMAMGLVGYDELAGNILSRFYGWTVKG